MYKHGIANTGCRATKTAKGNDVTALSQPGGEKTTKKTGSHFSKDKVSISITGLPNISFLTLTAVQAGSYSSPNGPCCSS